MAEDDLNAATGADQPGDSVPVDSSIPPAQGDLPAAGELSDLDAFLEEYSAANNPQPEPVFDQSAEELANTRHQLEMTQLEHNRVLTEQSQKADVEQFNRIVGSFGKAARDHGLPVTDDDARRWLFFELAANPNLRAVADQRHEGPDAARAFSRALSKAQYDFIKAEQSRPDPQATADRDAVAASMKATSHVIPPERPPQYGNMSDAEFQKELAKFGH